MAKKKDRNIINVVGYNFRLGEIESSILKEQMKKMPFLVRKREQFGKFLNKQLKDLEGLNVPKIIKKNTHSFYIYALRLDEKLSKKETEFINY